MTRSHHIPFNPHSALSAEYVLIPLEHSAGRVAAVHLNRYPPGDMFLCAGEILSASTVESLIKAVSAGEDIKGLVLRPEGPYVRVVDMPAYEVRCRKACGLTAQEIDAYCALFIETFSNGPYNQHSYRKDAWDTPISATQALYDRLPKKLDYVSIEHIDAFDLPDDLTLFHHPKITRAILTDRFSDPGYIGLLYERGTQNLKGFCSARVVPLERAWSTEEWKFPLLMSGNTDHEADEDRFFDKVYAAFNLRPNSEILSVSGLAIHPDVRGRDGWYAKLMAATVSAVTPQHAGLPGLTEISQTGSGRILNSAVSTKVVCGILENGNPLAFTPLASHWLWHYEGPSKRLTQAIRDQIQKERRNA